MLMPSGFFCGTDFHRSSCGQQPHEELVTSSCRECLTITVWLYLVRLLSCSVSVLHSLVVSPLDPFSTPIAM